jgi:hypothetical protein
MRVVNIPFGAVGIDCLSPIAAPTAKEIAAFTMPGTRTGFTFVNRYLENLTIAELAGLFAASLGVAFVSEARTSGWNATTGTQDGQRAVALAKALGLPQDATPLLCLACDMEGMGACAPADALDYATNRCAAVVSGGFRGEVYVGDSVPLTPAQLYGIPLATSYWRSLSNVQQVAFADYAKWQGYPTQTLQLPSGSWAADLNFVTMDKKGRSPTMVVSP